MKTAIFSASSMKSSWTKQSPALNEFLLIFGFYLKVITLLNAVFFVLTIMQISIS